MGLLEFNINYELSKCLVKIVNILELLRRNNTRTTITKKIAFIGDGSVGKTT